MPGSTSCRRRAPVQYARRLRCATAACTGKARAVIRIARTTVRKREEAWPQRLNCISLASCAVPTAPRFRYARPPMNVGARAVVTVLGLAVAACASRPPASAASPAAPAASGGETSSGPFACTLIIGNTTTQQWFDGGFLAYPGIDPARWEMLFVGHHYVDAWADPKDPAWGTAL